MASATEPNVIRCHHCSWEGRIAESIRGTMGNYFCPRCHNNGAVTHLAYRCSSGKIKYIGRVKHG